MIKLIRLRYASPLDYVSPGAMKELEVGAAKYGLEVKDLMENAGSGVARFVEARYPTARRVCVVCGGGNNGGDGLVAARHLASRFEVTVVLLVPPAGIRTEEARQNWHALAETPARLRVADEPASLERVSGEVSSADVVVVAIFGTGVRGGRVREPYASAITLVNAAKGAKVAVDLPSGIDPETGSLSTPTVRADVTLALHRPKTGLKGKEEYTGEVVVVPIGIREEGAAP